MNARLGWGAAVLALMAAIGGTAAVVAQDKDPVAPKVAPTKTLKPGDQVQVVVTSHVVVAADGTVTVPGVGKVDAAGKTIDEVGVLLSKQATEIGASIAVRSEDPRLVFVIGAVHGTVTMPASRGMRVLEVLAKATNRDSKSVAALEGADLSHVRVRRVGSSGTPYNFEVNVDDILERGQEAQNVLVQESDIVIVPKLEVAATVFSDFVYVRGAVGQAGRVPIVKGGTPFTLTKLIALSGDSAEFDDHGKVLIVRRSGGNRRTIEVDFNAVIEGKAEDIELQPDDLIYVPARK